MFPQFYTAASGMVAGSQTLDLVTGNLANVRTAGYRPDHPLFSSYLSETAARALPGAPPSAPRAVAMFSSWRTDEQGPIRESGNPLDVALQGPGWFRVETPQGERLTRAGMFSRGQDGRLVTMQGYAVLDEAGKPITLPDGRVAIGTDGTVTVGETLVGRLGIADGSASEMVREGDTFWRKDGPLVPLAPGKASVRQGHVEESAVNSVTELGIMLQAQWMYEMQQKLVDVTANTLARKAIELGEPR